MSEAAPEPQDTAQTEAPEADDTTTDEGKTFTQADVDRIIQGRLAKYKDYDELKQQVDGLRTASLTEQERAVEAARSEARSEAATEFGKELARTQFDALAGRRNPDFDTASALEFLDLSRFLSEDGRPDGEAIQAAVDRLIPTANAGPPSFDGGSRTSATTADFNQTLRRAAGRA